MLWLAPTLWMVSLSFQPNEDFARTLFVSARAGAGAGHRRQRRSPCHLCPEATLDRGALIVSLGMTLGVLLVSTPAGFAPARLTVPFKRSLTVLVLVGLMVPAQAVLIPRFTKFADFGGHNSHHALILPRMAVPVGEFLMMSFFRSIPSDIEEAARIEGVGWLQISWQVMLPLARPAMAQEVTLGRFFGACEDAGSDASTCVGEPCIIQSIANAASERVDGVTV